MLIAIGCLICWGAKALWHFYVAYGVFMGLGVICAGFVPMTVILSNWFVRKRGAALGVALIGNIQPPLLAVPIQQLITTFGWRNSYAILGAIAFLIIAPLDGLVDADPPRRMSVWSRTVFPGRKIIGLLGGAANNANPGYRSKSSTQKWAETDWTLGTSGSNPSVLALVRNDGGHGNRSRHDHASSCGHGVGRRAQCRSGCVRLQPGGRMCHHGSSGRISFGSVGSGNRFSSSWRFFFILSSLSLLIMIHSGAAWPLYLYALAYGRRGRTQLAHLRRRAADLFIGRGFGAILGFINISYGIGQGVGAWAGGAIFDKTGSYSLAMLTAVPLFAAMCLLFWLAGPRKIRKMVKNSSPMSSRGIEVRGKTQISLPKYLNVFR